jgi:hypothetical protein
MTTGQALRYVASGLPAGLRVIGTTGVITGTLIGPPGSSQVVVTVSAAGAPPVTVTFTWHVRS